MKKKGLVTTLALCAALTGLWIFAAAAANAQNKSNNEPKKENPQAVGHAKRAQTTVYGLHTLSRGQTLRLSVVNTSQEPPDPVTSPAGDASVRNLRLVRRVSRSFNLAPGQAATLDIEANRAGGEVVGAWTLGDPPDPIQPGAGDPPDPVRTALSTSLEVRENNSTKMVLPGTTRGFNPQPDPPRER